MGAGHADGGDVWDPGQYGRFAAERSAPFDDLLRLVRPVPGGDVADLGCGTGELTARLHAHAGAARTVGVDFSATMITRAHRLAGGGLRFERGDLRAFASPVDLIVSNAALHWVPDHAGVIARLAGLLRPKGQLAVQMPANAHHPSHRVAAEVAAREPFLSAMGGEPPPDASARVGPPERYAELLEKLGFDEQHVRLQVYGHRLGSTRDVVEWTKGTTLTRFRRVLPAALYAEFVDRYREALVATVGEASPYFYTFTRLLLWARRPG